MLDSKIAGQLRQARSAGATSSRLERSINETLENRKKCSFFTHVPISEIGSFRGLDAHTYKKFRNRAGTFSIVRLSSLDVRQKQIWLLGRIASCEDLSCEFPQNHSKMQSDV